ncbi:MAG: kelch repeat-containing protein [Chloroflexota bacterium]
MTDRELERRLRAWYGDGVGANETAPPALRESVAAIPAAVRAPGRRLGRRGGLTLLAAAAILIVGGAIAGGAGLLRLTAIVAPTPSSSPLTSPDPAATPTPAAVVRTGDLVVFSRRVQKAATCSFDETACPVPRVWIVGSDGRGAQELVADGDGRQDVLAWSPDGSRLLYSDNGKLYLTDQHGGRPQAIDTGCPMAQPGTPSSCQVDTQVAFSRDGRKIVFLRDGTDDAGAFERAVIATMDLATGQVTELTSTSPAGGFRPGWSADGSRIVFSAFGSKDDGGPLAPIPDAVFVVDADGGNLRQVSPPTLDAFDADWSPDGERILFLSPTARRPFATGDVYTIRPDGSDLRQVTTGGNAAAPSWTIDGRILFTRTAGGGADAGWWTADADGANAAILVRSSAIGLSGDDLVASRPALQPLGGPSIVPPPWKPAPAVAVGPPAPTPTPTPTPDLAAGFTWTGTPATKDDSPLGEKATLLADGRVLVTGGCSTAADLYDPATGTFTATGSLTAVRGGSTATRLQDGRVLVTGGYNCGKAGQDGIWASAEIYDPSAGTFSATGSMSTPREFHTATLLADGRVLIAGGYTAPQPTATSSVVLAAFRTAESSASVLATAEIYDPATGTFSRTGSMSTFRDNHTATLLEDGRVLVTGGGGEGYASSTSAEVYDPSTGKFTKTGSMKSGRWLHTATRLADGRVLILGGRSPKDAVYRSAEAYDPRSGTFSSAGQMVEGRQEHTATLLRDGRVLIAGGYWSDGRNWRVLSSSEMYDPATGKYTALGSIGIPRDGHTATLLGDGRVLIVGGTDIGRDGAVPVTSALLYQP